MAVQIHWSERRSRSAALIERIAIDVLQEPSHIAAIDLLASAWMRSTASSSGRLIAGWSGISRDSCRVFEAIKMLTQASPCCAVGVLRR